MSNIFEFSDKKLTDELNKVIARQKTILSNAAKVHGVKPENLVRLANDGVLSVSKSFMAAVVPYDVSHTSGNVFLLGNVTHGDFANIIGRAIEELGEYKFRLVVSKTHVPSFLQTFKAFQPIDPVLIGHNPSDTVVFEANLRGDRSIEEDAEDLDFDLDFDTEPDAEDEEFDTEEQPVVEPQSTSNLAQSKRESLQKTLNNAIKSAPGVKQSITLERYSGG